MNDAVLGTCRGICTNTELEYGFNGKRLDGIVFLCVLIYHY